MRNVFIAIVILAMLIALAAVFMPRAEQNEIIEIEPEVTGQATYPIVRPPSVEQLSALREEFISDLSANILNNPNFEIEFAEREFITCCDNIRLEFTQTTLQRSDDGEFTDSMTFMLRQCLA